MLGVGLQIFFKCYKKSRWIYESVVLLKNCALHHLAFFYLLMVFHFIVCLVKRPKAYVLKKVLIEVLTNPFIAKDAIWHPFGISHLSVT